MNRTLSRRLQTLAGLVPAGSRIADIGTDHGFVPIFLMEQGIAVQALAMDVRPGPLQRALEHVREAHLEDRIILRLSDGLDQLQPGEADTIIIAGMGGALMERILSEGKRNGKLEGIRCLVLGAQSEMDRVRSWILENGFAIDDEEMVREDGKYYPLIRAVRLQKREGEDPQHGAASWMSKTAKERECMLLYGPVLLRKRHPVLLEYLEKEARVCREIENQIRKSGGAEANRERLAEISSRLALIRAAQAGGVISVPERGVNDYTEDTGANL